MWRAYRTSPRNESSEVGIGRVTLVGGSVWNDRVGPAGSWLMLSHDGQSIADTGDMEVRSAQIEDHLGALGAEEVLVETTCVLDRKTHLRSLRAASHRSTLRINTVCSVIAAFGLLGRAPPLVAGSVTMMLVTEVSLRRRVLANSGTTGTTIRLTRVAVQCASVECASSRSWTTFKSLDLRKGFWILRINRRMAMVIPQASFDAEQTGVFLALADRHGLKLR